jgi:hypothetical protein
MEGDGDKLLKMIFAYCSTGCLFYGRNPIGFYRTYITFIEQSQYSRYDLTRPSKLFPHF